MTAGYAAAFFRLTNVDDPKRVGMRESSQLYGLPKKITLVMSQRSNASDRKRANTVSTLPPENTVTSCFV
jgi:hypothetical protein